MSLVENLINQIATKELGGITKPQGFNLDDDTFAKLLEKQLGQTQESEQPNLYGNFGVPAGLVIESFDGVGFSETAQDQLEAIGEVNLTNESLLNQPIEIKDLDMGDYFSNLLKTSGDNNFMNFAKKQATNIYNVSAKSFVSDLSDFVEDITSSI